MRPHDLLGAVRISLLQSIDDLFMLGESFTCHFAVKPQAKDVHMRVQTCKRILHQHISAGGRKPAVEFRVLIGEQFVRCPCNTDRKSVV